MRRAAKVDDNQLEIVKALLACGYSVQSLAAVGMGVPDLLVSGGPTGGNGQNWLLEVKDPTKPKADRQLTPAQKRWHAAWRGHVAVVETVEQALEAVGAKKARVA